MARPLLLVTNDDGVHAVGLRALVQAVAGLGDVIVAAPEGERSGSGHAMTFHTHLRAQQTAEDHESTWWAVSGTPVDCVYFGLMHLCDRAPALVLSGVNAGHNLGTDVFYSGTVGAAAEGFLRGIPGMAISVDRGIDPSWAIPVIEALARAMLQGGDTLLLNVNVPAPDAPAASTLDQIRELSQDRLAMITRLGRRGYHDAVDRRTDPMGRPYYWIGGPPQRITGEPGDDTWAVAQGLVSITPLELDITAPDLSGAQKLLDRTPELASQSLFSKESDERSRRDRP